MIGAILFAVFHFIAANISDEAFWLATGWIAAIGGVWYVGYCLVNWAKGFFKNSQAQKTEQEQINQMFEEMVRDWGKK